MAQIGYKNSLTSSCLAIYSSKLGYEDPGVQKNDIQVYAKKSGLKIDTYIDSASYDKLSIEQISDRFSKVQQPLVLIWRLDCLPMTIKSLEDLFRLFSALGKKNISFFSVADGIDTDTSAQAFSVALDKAWKEFKKNRKITNGRASSAKVKSKGLPFKTGRKKLRDDALIHSLRASGLSIRDIAEKIHLSTTAVQRSLKILRPSIDKDSNLLA